MHKKIVTALLVLLSFGSYAQLSTVPSFKDNHYHTTRFKFISEYGTTPKISIKDYNYNTERFEIYDTSLTYLTVLGVEHVQRHNFFIYKDWISISASIPIKANVLFINESIGIVGGTGLYGDANFFKRSTL